MHYNDYNRNEFLPVPAPAAQTEAAAPKKHTGRLVALALVCALLGGVAGGAAVRYIPALASRTTLYEGSHAPTVVSISNVTTEQPLTLPQIYASNLNSTVGITTELVTTNYWGQQVKGAAAGSGFVISQDGYILTNYHVIEGATAIQVAFADGRTYDATLVGGESPNDIAVLKIEAEDLTPVVLGDSDNLVVGEQVCAIGNPLGELTYTLTAGYVSARDDSREAAIEGIGFAIPINDVRDMVKDIMEKGYVTGKPNVGILMNDVSSEAQRYGIPAGAYIEAILDGSCAQTAGLKAGDIITAVDDTVVTTSSQLSSAVKNYKAGDTVTFTVFREGESHTLSVTLDESTTQRSQAMDALQQEYFQSRQQAQQQQQQSSGWPFSFFGW